MLTEVALQASNLGTQGQMEYAEERFVFSAHGSVPSDPGNTMKPAYEDLLHALCTNLKEMHKIGVLLHGDIKASNVLLFGSDYEIFGNAVLIDYVCSMSIIGTTFWRAPEILEQKRSGVPDHEVVFTDKADIYSFGMLCYEIVAGCIPCQSHP